MAALASATVRRGGGPRGGVICPPLRREGASESSSGGASGGAAGLPKPPPGAAPAVGCGTALARSDDAPAGGTVWGMFAGHATLPRGRVTRVAPQGSLASLLTGPSSAVDGSANLCGGLRRAMATAGYDSLKAFQRAEVVVGT